jgi:glyoxylase-like metal-dependent hydrolase (beta-lactamase superfamily II)
MHDLLLENQEHLGDVHLREYAGRLGLDVDAFAHDLAEHTHRTKHAHRNRPGDTMATTYEILVPGNSLEWSGGFLGFANLTLVTTSEGTLLFDTGHYINRAALVAALAARDMAPGDVDEVFLSHIHFDHADNVDLFTHATHLSGQGRLGVRAQSGEGRPVHPLGDPRAALEEQARASRP